MFGGTSSKKGKGKKDGVSSRKQATGGPANQRKTRSQVQDLSKQLILQQKMQSSNVSREVVGRRGQRGKMDLARLFYPDFYEYQLEEQ